MSDNKAFKQTIWVLLLNIIKRLSPRVFRHALKFILYAHELVVLADAVGAAHGAGFDLAGFQGHHEIGDEAVFGFA
jgi:hypothetical protein